MAPSLPAEYLKDGREPDILDSYYNNKYLEALRDSATSYTTSQSSSSLTGFHIKIGSGGKPDSFLIGKPAVFDIEDKKFHLPCDLRQLSQEDIDRGVPPLDKLTSYMYKTGPSVILEKAVSFEKPKSDLPSNQAVLPLEAVGPKDEVEPPQKTQSSETPRSSVILLKREGEANLWHCMMEIMAMTWTMDVLRMATDPDTGKPFFSEEDIENTQVVILDQRLDGKFFDLWRIFAKKPIIRIKDMTATEKFDNAIFPLAGGSTPFWKTNYDVFPAQRSELLRVFSERVLNWYNVPMEKKREGNIAVTFINRQWRKLTHEKEYVDELSNLGLPIDLKYVDLAKISFPDQLKLMRNTDVLIGFHGAGMTHSMWMKEGSAVAEIRPRVDRPVLGMRNLALMKGHSYFSAAATDCVMLDKPRRSELEDIPGFPSDSCYWTSGEKHWLFDNHTMEKERFLELAVTAIKSMYNKGLRNFDAA